MTDGADDSKRLGGSCRRNYPWALLLEITVQDMNLAKLAIIIHIA